MTTMDSLTSEALWEGNYWSSSGPSVTSTRERTSSHVGKLPSKGDRVNAKDNAIIPDNQIENGNDAET
jgi:hypothetical protein